MSLTGWPLILTVFLSTALVIAGTVLLWSRAAWPARALGVLLTEALVVAAVGLVANRSEEFYPSWRALSGDTGTTEATAPPPLGRLDATLTGAVPWHPSELSSWRLAAPPTVVVPADYRSRPSATYPVVLVLTSSSRETGQAVKAASTLTGVVTVVATPTAATTAAALGGVRVALGSDARVSEYGWGLVVSSREAALAAGLVDGTPGFVVGEALIGSGMRPAAAIAVAVVQAASAAKPPTGTCPRSGKPSPSGTPSPSGKPSPPGKRSPSGKPSSPGKRSPSGRPSPSGKSVSKGKSGSQGKSTPPDKSGSPGSPSRGSPSRPGGSSSPGTGAPSGKPVPSGKAVPPAPETTLTCPAGSVWAVAARWAVAQTSQPLQPPVRLPVGTPPAGHSAGPPPAARHPVGGLPAGGRSARGLPASGHSAGRLPIRGLSSGGVSAAGVSAIGPSAAGAAGAAEAGGWR